MIGNESLKLFMRSHELFKNDKYLNIKVYLKNILINYFKNLNEFDLTQLCENVVKKYIENKNLEKLKNLKILLNLKINQERILLLKQFKNWKLKCMIIVKNSFKIDDSLKNNNNYKTAVISKDHKFVNDLIMTRFQRKQISYRKVIKFIRKYFFYLYLLRVA